MRLLLALFFATSFLKAAAQPPQVPHKMNFAGITLTIRDDARKEIQKDVDALTQSPKHFNIKVERAKTYFPIIEKIFEEERVPDDFKYLVLQESALISDAVSVSNAVGFWQFKDFTAIEMGMRVDKEIDERMNISSASRGAAKYIKKNNFYFNNWIYALQAYQMGAGAVLKSVKDSESGARHMEITSRTYWYIKKYLAHKVAFEGSVTGPGQIQVITYENKNKKTLAELAKEVSVSETEMRAYNKWAKNGTIPADRTYAVMIPVIGDTPAALSTSIAATMSSAKVEARKADVVTLGNRAVDERIKINGIAAIMAREGDNATRLAERGQADLSEFLKWNDISISDRVLPGQYYLLGKKRARASVAYHKVSTGESLWQISQRYGVQMRKLKKYNKIDSDRDLKPDMMLWLSATKPKDESRMAASTEVVQVDKSETFSWSVNPEQAEQAPMIDAAIIAPKVEEVRGDQSKAPKDTSVVMLETKPDLIVQSPTIKNEGVLTPKAHTVQAGETLYGIAQQYQVSVMDMVTWNNLNLQNGIKPGQVLQVTGQKREIENAPIAQTQEVVKPSETEHIVKSTDTLYSIARKYGVTIKDLMEWNGKKDFSVSVGEKLTIKQK